jgi:hypothetical protein
MIHAYFFVFSPMLLVVCHCRTTTQRMAMLSKTKLLTEVESVPITIDNAQPLTMRPVRCPVESIDDGRLTLKERTG